MLVRHGCGLPYYSSCTLPKSHSHDGFMQVSPSHQQVDPNGHFRGITWKVWNNLSSLGGGWGEPKGNFQERLPRRLRWVSQVLLWREGYTKFVLLDKSNILMFLTIAGGGRVQTACHPVCASLQCSKMSKSSTGTQRPRGWRRLLSHTSTPSAR